MIARIMRYAGLFIAVAIFIVGAYTQRQWCERQDTVGDFAEEATHIVLPRTGANIDFFKIRSSGDGQPGNVLLSYGDQICNAKATFDDNGQIVSMDADVLGDAAEETPRHVRATFARQEKEFRGDPVYDSIVGIYGDERPWLSGKRCADGTFAEQELF